MQSARRARCWSTLGTGHASFWFERDNVARTIELLGEDNVMFETDETASRVYGIPLP